MNEVVGLSGAMEGLWLMTLMVLCKICSSYYQHLARKCARATEDMIPIGAPLGVFVKDHVNPCAAKK